MDDNTIYWIIGIMLTVYIVLALICPLISWIVIAAGVCCWFGGN